MFQEANVMWWQLIARGMERDGGVSRSACKGSQAL